MCQIFRSHNRWRSFWHHNKLPTSQGICSISLDIDIIRNYNYSILQAGLKFLSQYPLISCSVQYTLYRWNTRLCMPMRYDRFYILPLLIAGRNLKHLLLPYVKWPNRIQQKRLLTQWSLVDFTPTFLKNVLLPHSILNMDAAGVSEIRWISTRTHGVTCSNISFLVNAVRIRVLLSCIL
jgi:hypothetical protein